MGAVATATLAGLRRRRLAAAVIALVLVLATAAGTLALDILVESQAPFDNAFARANGAHLALTFDSGRASAAQIADTARAPGVTDSSRPWPVATIQLLETLHNRSAGGNTTTPGNDTIHLLRPAKVAGRASPDTSLDRITLDAGRWWRAAGEIVVSRALAANDGLRVGDSVTLQEAPDGGNVVQGYVTPEAGSAAGSDAGASGDSGPSRKATIVGIAASISTPDTLGWLSPADIAAMTPGRAAQEQMLYRVSSAASAAELGTSTAAITHALPAASLVASQTYLTTRDTINRTGAIMVPILLAFAAFALLAAAFMIVNVVSGIVLSSFRGIGVMKAIGYTPAQVAAVLVGQILVPASLGALIGLAIGALGSQPVLGWTAQSLGLPAPFTLSPLVAAVVVAAAIGLVCLAALWPALRAGRMSAARAINPSPVADGGAAGLRRRLLALPVGEAGRIGLGASLARPLRTAMTLGALAGGVAAVVFSAGVSASLGDVAEGIHRDVAAPVRATYMGGVGVSPKSGAGAAAGTPSVMTPAEVSAAIAGDPSTGRSVALAQLTVDASALSVPVPFIAYDGDSSWLGYDLIGGRWFERPGEAVAPSNFFDQGGLRIGDGVTLSYRGRSVRVTLVGEIFDLPREQRQGLLVRGEWADLAAIDPGVAPDAWEIAPRAGTAAQAYRSNLQQVVRAAAAIDTEESSGADTGFLLFETVIGLLGAVLVGVSAAGVFNTVLLETRERAREIAILKALGMSPRQVAGMVVGGILPVAVLAGVAGVPLGLLLQRAVLTVMGQAAGPTAIPEDVLASLPLGIVAALGLSGLVIGAVAAWLPARRAARASIGPILQAE